MCDFFKKNKIKRSYFISLFVSRFISRCQLVFEIISSAVTIKDKLAILISLFLVFISRLFYQIKIKKIPATYNFMIKNVTLKNKDGIFYCRKQTIDFIHILPGFEKEIRGYFNLTNGVFVDVGAHIGKYTITMAKRIGDYGKVIALEPDYNNYRILEKNIFLNKLKNVTLLKKALWRKKDKLKLYYPENLSDKDTGNTGASTMIYHPNWKYHIIEVDTLDNILKELGIKKVDLIKIDVEGVEIEVLEGAKETLKQGPKIIFECFDDEKMSKMSKISDILRPYKYKIKRTALDSYYFAYKT